eukprot:4523302-Prymnesium_polylepis.1
MLLELSPASARRVSDGDDVDMQAIVGFRDSEVVSMIRERVLERSLSPEVVAAVEGVLEAEDMCARHHARATAHAPPHVPPRTRHSTCHRARATTRATARATTRATARAVRVRHRTRTRRHVHHHTTIAAWRAGRRPRSRRALAHAARSSRG